MGPGQCLGAGYPIIVLFMESMSYDGNPYESVGAGNSGIQCGMMLSQLIGCTVDIAQLLAH